MQSDRSRFLNQDGALSLSLLCVCVRPSSSPPSPLLPLWQLQALNAIMFPAVEAATREEVAQLGRAGHRWVVVEAALLFEARWDRWVRQTPFSVLCFVFASACSLSTSKPQSTMGGRRTLFIIGRLTIGFSPFPPSLCASMADRWTRSGAWWCPRRWPGRASWSATAFPVSKK